MNIAQHDDRCCQMASQAIASQRGNQGASLILTLELFAQ